MMFLLAPLAAALPLVPDTALAGEPLRLTPYPQLVAARYTVNDGLPPGGVVRVQVVGKRVFAVTTQAAAELDGARWKPSTEPPIQQMPEGIDVHVLPPGERLLSWARTRSGG